VSGAPGRWPYRPLGDLVEILDSRRIPVSASERAARPGSVPYYGATGRVGTIDQPLFNEPLLLLGEDGVQFFDPSKPKAYRVSGPSWVNNHAHVLRARPAADQTFLEHYLNHFDYRGYANGTTRLKLTQVAMRRIPVPVPALAEQRRIVAILEEHLTSLDVAESALTSAGRRSASLMAKVLSQSRTGELVPLPGVAAIQGGIQKQQKRSPRHNAYPFLRVANVTSHGLDLAEVHLIELFGDELDRLRLREGDLLVVEGNGSPAQIGRAALWDGSIADCVHQNHLIRIRADRTQIVPEYLEVIWNSPENRRILTDVSSSSSGLHTLSVSKLERLLLPVPSVTEQLVIVETVERHRAAQRRLDVSLQVASARVRALRRSLLAAAFSGRLTGRASDSDVIETIADQEAS